MMNDPSSCRVIEESVFVVDDEAIFENITREEDSYHSLHNGSYKEVSLTSLTHQQKNTRKDKSMNHSMKFCTAGLLQRHFTWKQNS